jgi:NlpC/P60 family
MINKLIALLIIIITTSSCNFVFSQNIDSTFVDTITLSPIVYITQDSLDFLIQQRDSLVDELLHYADTFLGVPYKWAGRSRAGFDCSGFVSTIFAHINVPLSTSATYMEGSGRQIPDSLIKVGDIIYFQGTQRNHVGASHVAIAYEILPNDVIFIHVAVNGGVRYDRLSSAYYTKHYYKTERIELFDVEYRFKASNQ